MVLLAALALSGLFRLPAPLARGARRLVSCASSREPRLILTSGGLATPELERSFFKMLRRVSTRRSDGEPSIAMLVTAQMAPSGTPSKRSPGERT
jgi:hypothetical protein